MEFWSIDHRPRAHPSRERPRNSTTSPIIDRPVSWDRDLDNNARDSDRECDLFKTDEHAAIANTFHRRVREAARVYICDFPSD